MLIYSQPSMGMFHYYDLSYSEVFVYDDFIINQIREDEEISVTHILMLKEIVKKHFNNKEFIYISNRVTVYEVNPLTINEVEKIENLLAVIIVASSSELMKKAKTELKDLNKPKKVCKTLTEAIFWADKLNQTKKV